MGTRKSKTFCEREFNQIGWKLCFEYENVHKKCIFCYSIFSIVNSQKPKMTMRAAKINNIFFNIPGVKESPIRILCFRTWIPLERREQLLLQWVDDFQWRWCWDEVDSVDNVKNGLILPRGQWYAPSAVINDAWYCIVLHGIAWYCMILNGFVSYCIVSYDIAWCCMV